MEGNDDEAVTHYERDDGETEDNNEYRELDLDQINLEATDIDDSEITTKRKIQKTDSSENERELSVTCQEGNIAKFSMILNLNFIIVHGFRWSSSFNNK